GTAPPLPDSEWSRVLANRPVSLDAINTGAFSAEIDDKVTQKVGDFTISTGSAARSSKPISNGLEWYHVFDIAVEAMVYAYPHRRAELRTYREYIRTLFGALHTSHHSAIINLDKVIRKYVCESADLELSSIGSFYALQMAFLTPFRNWCRLQTLTTVANEGTRPWNLRSGRDLQAVELEPVRPAPV
ncbi:hypothetical protein FIBSPDRAFT_753148, partial [Athelia psychrophila]